jgi:hypothetical protein
MLALDLKAGEGWWFATGAVILVIGVTFLGGSSLTTPFIPGNCK